ncbi:MAG: glutathione peroxidase [Phycisphaerales bacterium]|nr:glutathione peroxidase [Phycisphaerales bacterium]
MNDRYVLDYTMNSIDGESVDLAQYKGKVLLFVNVASKCGNTPQYAGLEKLYRGRKDAGLVVLGFPANNFGGQEPGTDKEIKQFCTEKYSVTFPMFSKISVKGDDAHPLYQQLATLSEAPNWNFTKYLVDRDGQFVQRFDPRTRPDDAELEAKIEALLAVPASAK